MALTRMSSSARPTLTSSTRCNAVRTQNRTLKGMQTFFPFKEDLS